MDTETPIDASPNAENTPAMDADTPENNEGTIDESNRYTGEVVKYEYRRGFGLIKGEGNDGKLVYVHWKQIESSDDWPALTKGMKVEYYVGERVRGGKGKRAGETQKFAAKVTGEGGTPVSVSQEDLSKTYPDRATRFTGTVKWFHTRKGYGFVKPNEDIEFAEKKFPAANANIYIAREDVKTNAETAPVLKDGQEIEFTLYKRAKASNWGAGDVTKAGGVPFEAEDFGELGPRINFKRKQGFGPNRGRKGKKGGQQMMMIPVMGGGGGKNMMKQMQQMMQMQMMQQMMMGGMMGGGMPMMMVQGGGKKKGRKQNTIAKW